MKSKYIDCDYIIYEDMNGKKHICPNLNDYTALCNHGLWRDGNIANALWYLQNNEWTDMLRVYKDGKEIMQITRDTPKEAYTV